MTEEKITIDDSNFAHDKNIILIDDKSSHSIDKNGSSLSSDVDKRNIKHNSIASFNSATVASSSSSLSSSFPLASSTTLPSSSLSSSSSPSSSSTALTATTTTTGTTEDTITTGATANIKTKYENNGNSSLGRKLGTEAASTSGISVLNALAPEFVPRRLLQQNKKSEQNQQLLNDIERQQLQGEDEYIEHSGHSSNDHDDTDISNDNINVILNGTGTELFNSNNINEIGNDNEINNEKKTYAEVAQSAGNDNNDGGATFSGGITQQYDDPSMLLCPYEECPYKENCVYVHCELCDMCGQNILHPTNKELRRAHINECISGHERQMELSFAIARSQDKVCGICFDKIFDTGHTKRFGILPNCNHVFCLDCIRKWRQAKQFKNTIIRACPECRISSDYVCPSPFWVDTKEQKEQLLTDYKSALGEKDCKYFKKGAGECPFGNKCFYKHALPNGKRIDVGIPRKQRKLFRSNEEIYDLLDLYLWEFVDRRNHHRLQLDFETDSDDSEYYLSQDLMNDE